MPKPTIHRHPSLEDSTSLGSQNRHSLFDAKDEFIERIGPVAVAAIYFGGFSLAPQDSSLARQALYKLSFLYRHFLQPAGLRIEVEKTTAILSGSVDNAMLLTMGDLLAHQIEGIRQVKSSAVAVATAHDNDSSRQPVQFLFATDQTLRSGVQISSDGDTLVLDGQVASTGQKTWAEQLAEAATSARIESHLRVSAFTPPPMTPASEPPQLDDESLQALVLFRLRLVRETTALPVKVKATRGVVTLHGKVRTEALRQRVENITRSTLGIRELRSSLSISS